MRLFATDANLKKYPTKIVRMCQDSVIENEQLESEFSFLIGSLVEGNDINATNTIVSSLYKGLVS